DRVTDGRDPGRDVARVGGIGAVVDLVAVRVRVAVTVDADPHARARRHAREGHLLARRAGERAHRPVRDEPVAPTVRLETAAADLEVAPPLAADLRLRDEVALAVVRALHEQRNARVDRRAIRAGARDLLADDRGEVAVEGHHEVFDLSAERVAGRARGD